ncbi:MAG: hypothetical protein Q7S48_03535 [bacterium]|nr:hypothetical protein [bacterium]
MFEALYTTLSQPYFGWIQKLLSAHPDAQIFLVGGAVRDAILGKISKDYDFVVRGVQARHLQEFLGTVGIVNLVGRTFGVYKFIPDDGYEQFKQSGLEAFDIALPRTEHAWGTGGYRDVEVQSNHELLIEEDLGRRDFTINAMALELKSEIRNLPAGKAGPKSETNPNDKNYKLNLIDPYHGMEDISSKLIRAVGDPKERFEEDYTRMLRALRFACELGFTIEAETLEALKTVMPSINDKRADVGRPILSPLAEFVAPREVVSRELLRAFYANPVRAFDLYDESGAFLQLAPELLKMKGCPQPEEFHSEGDVWTHTRMALEALESEEYGKMFGEVDPHYNALLIMAVLFHDVGKPPMLKTPENDGVDPAPFPIMALGDDADVSESASRLISDAKQRQTEERGGASRIRFDEHDTVGAEITREIARRLVLSIMVEGPLHVDYNFLTLLIKHHLILLHTKAEDFKASTVEKYFFNPKFPGDTLLRLAFCDGSAAIPKEGGVPSLQNLYDMIARIKRMEKAVAEKRVFVKPLINGNEIMEILKIPAGPGIGELLRELKEEQLSARVTTKEAAIEWLKKSFE